MKRSKTSSSILKVKPSALKTNIAGLINTLGFMNQEQIREGWRFLGDGAYQRKII